MEGYYDRNFITTHPGIESPNAQESSEASDATEV